MTESLASLLPNLVFTVDVAVCAAAGIWLLARRYFPDSARRRRIFALLSVGTLAVRAAYVALFVYLFPKRIVSTDGSRYLFEIRHIAWAPWAWNPVTGSGPHYQATAKMGMSYLYGLVLFVHQIDSLYAVLVLNLVCGLLTGIAVFALTRQLSDSVTPAFLAMALVSVYPETLFWTARVTRENLTLFLVPALIHASLRLHRTFRIRYALYGLIVVVILLLTRAQLALFTVLITMYFAAVSLRARRRSATLAVAAGTGLLLYGGFTLVEAQIRRAVGSAIFDYLTLDAAFWLSRLGSFTENIGAVLSPVARGDYGAVGILILPVVLVAFGLFVMALLRFRQVFRGHGVAAGLVVFVTLSFLAMLAFFGSVNIRYRSTVAPFVVSIISVSACYFWSRLRLPVIRLRSLPATPARMAPAAERRA